MSRTGSRSRPLGGLIGAGLLLVAGLLAGLLKSPDRPAPGRSPSLLTAVRLEKYLAGSPPPEADGAVDRRSFSGLEERVLEHPIEASRRLETGLVRLWSAAPTPLGLLGSTAPFFPDWGVREETAGSGRPQTDVEPLPLRAIELPDELAFQLLEVSAENLDRMSVPFRSALTELVGSIDRVALMLGPPGGAGRFGDGELQRARELARRALDGSLGDGPLSAEQVELIERCEPRRIQAALHDLVGCVDRLLPVLESARVAPFVRELRPLPDGAGIPRNLVLVTECLAGLVLVGGPGTTVLPLDGVALAIDLGGDDRWSGGVSIGGVSRPEPAARVLLDLAGRDLYAGVGFQIGSACLGAALLVDLSGDDRYESKEFEFGAACLGGAVLIDLGGQDRYRCDRAGLGFGMAGLGLLFDSGQDDRYQCSDAALGCATLGGVGLLVDHWGDDLYLAFRPRGGQSEVGSPGPVMGASFPATPGRVGGVGVLLDRRGSDVYRADGAALGSVNGVGVGCLLDGEGDDLYTAGDFGLGAAGPGGLAVFRDLAGDDEYLSRRFSLGFGRAGIGLFIDDQGTDRSLGLSPSKGRGERGGTGLFADVAGD